MGGVPSSQRNQNKSSSENLKFNNSTTFPKTNKANGLRRNSSQQSSISPSLIKTLQNPEPNTNRRIVTKSVEHPYVLSTTCTTIQGHSAHSPNKPNQDNFIMETDPVSGAILLGVFDGHGEMGHIVAQFLANYLRQYLFEHALFPSKIETAVRECIHNADREIQNNGIISVNFSGTTLCLAIFYNNKVVFANLGDSRAISIGLNTKNILYANQITIDHKPELKKEKTRIELTGGKVAPIKNKDGLFGPSRVWLPEMNLPGLAMSRSFGDVVAHSIGVTTEPEFFTLNLEKSDCAAIVIATDGLWDFVSNEEVAAEASSVLFDHKSLLSNLTWMSTSRWLEQHNGVDDITITVAVLKNMQRYLDIKRVHSFEMDNITMTSFSSNENSEDESTGSNLMNDSDIILTNEFCDNDNYVDFIGLNNSQLIEPFDSSTRHGIFCDFHYLDQHFTSN